MWVEYATQVFSKSMADGRYYSVRKVNSLWNSAGTIKPMLRMNDFFDALNRRHATEAIRREVQTSPWIARWHAPSSGLTTWNWRCSGGDISSNMFLTQCTAQGLWVTFKSTLDLTEYLLSNCQLEYVLTAKSNQDPLERFLGTGCMRQWSSRHDYLLAAISEFVRLQFAETTQVWQCEVQEEEGVRLLRVLETPSKKIHPKYVKT